MRAAVVNRLLKKRALATTGGSSATSFQKSIIWVGVKPQEIIAALSAPAEVPLMTAGPSAKRGSRSRRS